MPNVHPTAIVDPRAQLADSAEVAAYSIIKGKVTIGPGTVVLTNDNSAFTRDPRIDKRICLNQLIKANIIFCGESYETIFVFS